MIWFDEFAEWHKEDLAERVSIGYTGMAWMHHISDLAIRITMAIATRLIMLAWTDEEKAAKQLKDQQNSSCDKFKCLVKGYKTTGIVVSSLQTIFQVWFVASWIIYFIGITGNTVLVLEELLHTNRAVEQSHRFWFYFAHLINDITVFLVPYICGGLMNYYHEN